MRRRDTLPGRGLAIGLTVTVLTVAVLIPLAMIALVAFGGSAAHLRDVAFSARALASYEITFGASFVAATLDAGAGFLIAWVLVRHRFVGRALLDALIDVPFALPTAVTGIALATLYGANGIAGQALAKVGIHIAYTPAGITLALTFIGLPFVVRTVQPVLEALPTEFDEAASLLGASRSNAFRRITLPLVLPAVLTGFGLALARGLGEYGSVLFISGNIPWKTEIAPLLIVSHLEQYDEAGAAAIAVVLLIASLSVLIGINAIERVLMRARTAL